MPRSRPAQKATKDEKQQEMIWKPVRVLLGDNTTDGDSNDDSDSDYQRNDNHYDNSKLISSADFDLEAEPGEHVGIFYGLEVLENYQVVGSNKEKTKKTEMEKNNANIKNVKIIRNDVENHNDEETEKEEKIKSDVHTNQETLKKKTKTKTKTKPKKNKKEKKELSSDHLPSLSASKEEKDELEEGEKTQEATESKKPKEKTKKSLQEKRKKDECEDKPKSTATAAVTTKTTTTTTTTTTNESNKTNDEQKAKENEQEVYSLQTNWMMSTGGVTLNYSICSSLLQQGFWNPTPIQASTLPAAILGRRNMVGAAPTGSGKTLAYLLPIFQHLLEKEKEETEEEKEKEEEPNKQQAKSGEEQQQKQQQQKKQRQTPLQALVLTPTRELAKQIHAECNKLHHGFCGSIVGGLAHHKQKRVLEKNRPPIIVATPGRLWEMISSRSYKHLNDLSQVRFLVIDEADRMIQQGSFPQLTMILNMIHRDNPMEDIDDDGNPCRHEDGDDDEDDDDVDSEDDGDRLLALPGIPGEAKVEMLTDEILEQQKRYANENKDHDMIPEVKEMDNEEYAKLEKQAMEEYEATLTGTNSDDDDDDLPLRSPVYRQTFVYSATLTLPSSTPTVRSPSNSSGNKKGNKKHQRHNVTSKVGVDGAIAEILEKARAKGKTKVIDLSSSNSKMPVVVQANKKNNNERKHQREENEEQQQQQLQRSQGGKFNLPLGLSLHLIQCTQRHKDSHLYAYLMTTRQGSSGPCLIFCNSISGVRRVGATLQTLGLPVRLLHAQMQQRARFKAIESLQDPKNRAIVVSTDVAARGLDIPSVATVIHYDLARSVDSFVHRSGRTARGTGEGAYGSSLSLVSPAEDKTHNRIVHSLKVDFDIVQLDGRLLSAAQERVNLASKIVAVDDEQNKSQKTNQWYADKAKEAELELDEDEMELLFESGGKGNYKRYQQQVMESKTAKQRLHQLLKEPMVTRRFGKFLQYSTARVEKNDSGSNSNTTSAVIITRQKQPTVVAPFVTSNDKYDSLDTNRRPKKKQKKSHRK